MNIAKILQSKLKSAQGLPESINDLKESEFSGNGLSEDRQRAMKNFDLWRVSVLNKTTSEEEFHKKFTEIQALANLSDWREFLKEEYSVEE